LSNDGKFIEKQIGKALTNLLGKEAVATRLHDTKSAAFFLPPSPADFMGIFKGGIPLLLEAKSSDEHLSFKECRVKSYVKPTQYAYHKMWMSMGGVSLFIFHSVLTGEAEYYDGLHVLEAYKDKWDKTLTPHKTTHSVKDLEAYIPVMVSRVNHLIKEGR